RRPRRWGPTLAGPAPTSADATSDGGRRARARPPGPGARWCRPREDVRSVPTQPDDLASIRRAAGTGAAVGGGVLGPLMAVGFLFGGLAAAVALGAGALCGLWGGGVLGATVGASMQFARLR